MFGNRALLLMVVCVVGATDHSSVFGQLRGYPAMEYLKGTWKCEKVVGKLATMECEDVIVKITGNKFIVETTNDLRPGVPIRTEYACKIHWNGFKGKVPRRRDLLVTSISESGSDDYEGYLELNQDHLMIKLIPPYRGDVYTGFSGGMSAAIEEMEAFRKSKTAIMEPNEEGSFIMHLKKMDKKDAAKAAD